MLRKVFFFAFGHSSLFQVTHSGSQVCSMSLHLQQLCTIKVPMLYIIDQLECDTYQCYFISALFDIFILKGAPRGTL